MIRCIAGMVGCLDGRTKIKVLVNKKVKNISLKNLPENFTVLTSNNKSMIKSFAPARKIFTGEKDVFRIKFDHGEYVDATINHRFFDAITKKEITVGEILNHVKHRCHKGDGSKGRIHLLSNGWKMKNENHFYGKHHSLKTRKFLHEKFYKTGIKAYRHEFIRGKLPKYCQDCGIKSRKTIVHHKNEDRHDNRLYNLKILCTKCHSTYHEWGCKKQ